MSRRSKAGQSTGSKRAGLLLDRPKRKAPYTRRSSLQDVNRTASQLYGRIRESDTGYTSTACLKSFAEVTGTSTFEQVGHVVKK
jgi:hypothetical protein